jgi:hypothetical protein
MIIQEWKYYNDNNSNNTTIIIQEWKYYNDNTTIIILQW